MADSSTVLEWGDDFWTEASTIADAAEEHALSQLGPLPFPDPPASSQALQDSVAMQISMSSDLVPAPIISGLTSGIDCIAIISLSENTDAVLNDLNLNDKVIPHLRILVVSIHNTKWEMALTSSKWGLSPQEASILAKALNEDLTPGNRHNIIVKFDLFDS